MSDISDCIIKILADNGVSVKQTDIWKDNGSARNVKSIIELDFSAHDKVFENEIAGLKAKIAIKDMDYKTASELLGKYQQENESLKQHIAELEDKIGDRDEINRCLREKIEELQKENEHLTEEYKVMSDFANKQMQKNERLKCDIDKMATSKSEWIDRAVEWQQKCEKLESKESVKSMRIEFHADNGEMLTPLEVANALINQNTFKVDELRELSEFLQVYCNHHEDRDIEPSIMLF